MNKPPAKKVSNHGAPVGKGGRRNTEDNRTEKTAIRVADGEEFGGKALGVCVGDTCGPGPVPTLQGRQLKLLSNADCYAVNFLRPFIGPPATATGWPSGDMPPKFTPAPPQVGRYWPGKPLEAEEQSTSDEEEDEEDEQREDPPPPEPYHTIPSKLVMTMKTTTLSEPGPYVQSEDESSDEDDEDDDNEALPPEKHKSRVRQPHRKAVGDFHAADQIDLRESSAEEEESSSEEEESSEDEDQFPPRKPLLRPSFVPKTQRDKPANGGNTSIGLTAYQSPSDAPPLRDRDKSKSEAIQFVENELRNAAQTAFEAEQHSSLNKGFEAIDDTDDIDPALEKSAWKLRELNRLKRDREALIARDLERETLEQRRNMEDSERLAEDLARAREIAATRAEKRGRPEFMQKYYHKGAFFQDEALLARDYNVATAEEHRHKEVLPKSLQIRSGELGRASRTKWTHLAAEDTSRRDSPWFDEDNSSSKRTLGRMGGMHDPLDRERKRKRG